MLPNKRRPFPLGATHSCRFDVRKRVASSEYREAKGFKGTSGFWLSVRESEHVEAGVRMSATVRLLAGCPDN